MKRLLPILVMVLVASAGWTWRNELNNAVRSFWQARVVDPITAAKDGRDAGRVLDCIDSSLPFTRSLGYRVIRDENGRHLRIYVNMLPVKRGDAGTVMELQAIASCSLEAEWNMVDVVDHMIRPTNTVDDGQTHLLARVTFVVRFYGRDAVVQLVNDPDVDLGRYLARGQIAIDLPGYYPIQVDESNIEPGRVRESALRMEAWMEYVEALTRPAGPVGNVERE